MAFVSGIANSQVQLKDALTTVCAANGWTFTGTVLHRGNVFVRLWHKETAGWANSFYGQLGKGMEVDGSALVDPIGHSVGPGGSTRLQPIEYPVTYDIHVFDNEVFMVYWDSQNRHFWIAFGQSSPFDPAPGVGESLWIGGTQSETLPLELGTEISGTSDNPIVLGLTRGGSPASTYWDGTTSAALFWWSTLSAVYGYGYGTSSGVPLSMYITNSVFTDSQGLAFGGNVREIQPVTPGFPVLELPGGTLCSGRQLNKLGQLVRNRIPGEKNMLPIFAGHTLSPTTPSFDPLTTDIEVANARYFRLGLNAARDIITVGRDRWKVYPWYKLNAADGYYDASDSPGSAGGRVGHTGSFGWAIKYTGP